MAKIKNPLTLIPGSDNAEVMFRTAVSGATSFSVSPASKKNSMVMVRLDEFDATETTVQSVLAVYVNGTRRHISASRARYDSNIPNVAVSNETSANSILTVSPLGNGFYIMATRAFGAGKRYAFFLWNEV